MTLGKCVRCANAAYSERPDMYFCKDRGTLINTTFAGAMHGCFVPRADPRTASEEME